jgi:hypothetical protein
MHFFRNKIHLLSFGLIAIAATGCQSLAQPPLALVSTHASSSGTDCEKADAMWRGRILPSRYAQLPPLTSPGIIDSVKLMTPGFSVKALTFHGDELEPGREKLIHAFGAEARLRLVINPSAIHRNTGFFSTGTNCAIARFSLAKKPESDTSIPGFALKIFVSGERPSVNLLMMHSVDEEPGHNYFAQNFTNILPPAVALSKRLLAHGFKGSAVVFGAKDTNPGRLTLEHIASSLPTGEQVPTPKVPHQLILKSTALARSLMSDATAADDFRVRLARLSAGQAIYDVYTLMEGELPADAILLGQLILATPIVSSRYGDEKLYFQHNMARK